MVLIGFIVVAFSVVAYLMYTGFMFSINISDGLLVRVGDSEGFEVKIKNSKEGFSNSRPCNKCRQPGSACACNSNCNKCRQPKSMCGCNGAMVLGGAQPAPIAPCPRVMEPDLSKYILKSQVPSCSRGQLPEMSNYMLKTECPPVPDLSKYILKSSIPKPQPVIIDNSKCKTDSGECPPCPRPRCPVVKCPPPTRCPPPAPCPRAVCPPTVVKCKSEESYNPTVRPFLAPLNSGIFGNA
jgi:hypothetical protein